MFGLESNKSPSIYFPFAFNTNKHDQVTVPFADPLYMLHKESKFLTVSFIDRLTCTCKVSNFTVQDCVSLHFAILVMR